MRPKKVILLVDQDGPELSALKFLLETYSFRVIEATSGQQAIALFVGTETVNLVMAEASMPGMKGAELLTRLKKMRHWVPMALLAGAEVAIDIDGVHDRVIRRPVPSLELLDVVKLMCARKRGPRKGSKPPEPAEFSESSTGFIHRDAESVGKMP